MRVEDFGNFNRKFLAMPHPITPMPMNPYVTFGKVELRSVVVEGDILDQLWRTLANLGAL
jgi:hypothetical protein